VPKIARAEVSAATIIRKTIDMVHHPLRVD
jgi:hypothetical protein